MLKMKIAANKKRICRICRDSYDDVLNYCAPCDLWYCIHKAIEHDEIQDHAVADTESD
jgi:hypothetical protein